MKKLSVYGVGPYFFTFAVILEAIGIALALLGYLDSGIIYDTILLTLLYMVGTICIVFGLLLYIPSAFGKRPIGEFIKNDMLCTDGMYGIVRNPIYSGLIYILSGILCFFLNYWLFLIPLILYISLSILLILTEEKWLERKFGLDYLDYKARVNRLIPWFNKRGGK